MAAPRCRRVCEAALLASGGAGEAGERRRVPVCGGASLGRAGNCGEAVPPFQQAGVFSPNTRCVFALLSMPVDVIHLRPVVLRI